MKVALCKEASKEAGSYQHKEGSNSLVITLLEQARVGGVGDIERHLHGHSAQEAMFLVVAV